MSPHIKRVIAITTIPIFKSMTLPTHFIIGIPVAVATNPTTPIKKVPNLARLSASFPSSPIQELVFKYLFESVDLKLTICENLI